MKKTSLLPLLLLFTIASHSQSLFGIFAGPQATTAKYTIADVKQPTEYKFGFHAGVGWKIPFDNNLYFSPAAFYSLKGYKVKFNNYSTPPDIKATDNNTTIHTFELAFLLQYDLGKKPNHFFIKAGPSLDFQLKGKERFNLNTGDRVSRNMIYGFADYGHFLANMIVQPGFETKNGIVISAMFSPGIISLNNADGGPQILHRVYGLSIGKYFNKKKMVIDTRNKE
jgi:Outer membrane protein beta-barrel domain